MKNSCKTFQSLCWKALSCMLFLDLLHLIENVFTLTPALTLTLKRNYVFGLTKWHHFSIKCTSTTFLRSIKHAKITLPYSQDFSKICSKWRSGLWCCDIDENHTVHPSILITQFHNIFFQGIWHNFSRKLCSDILL